MFLTTFSSYQLRCIHFFYNKNSRLCTHHVHNRWSKYSPWINSHNICYGLRGGHKFLLIIFLPNIWLNFPSCMLFLHTISPVFIYVLYKRTHSRKEYTILVIMTKHKHWVIILLSEQITFKMTPQTTSVASSIYIKVTKHWVKCRQKVAKWNFVLRFPHCYLNHTQYY